MVDVELDWAMVERDLSFAEDDDVVFQKFPDEVNSAQEISEGRPKRRHAKTLFIVVV